jgi:hypothetical protein
MPASFIQTSPKIKLLQSRFKQAMQLAMDRAAGHLDNPQQYPLPADAQAAETAFYRLFAALPNLRQRKVIDKAKARLKTTGAQRIQHYGELASLGVANPKSCAELAAALPVAENLRLTQADLDAIHAENRQRAVPRATAPKARPRIGANPTLLFFVDSLTCQKTSEVRKDEVNLAGFGADGLNQVQNLTPFFAGEFKKGDSTALNRQLFSFALDNNSSVELGFAANLFLVEEDWMRNTGLSGKLNALFTILGISLVTIAAGMAVVLALGGPGSVAVIMVTLVTGIVLQIVGALFGIIGDDTSTTASDTIVLEPPFVVGTRVDKTLNFEMLNFDSDLTKGRYTAAVHWEVVA